MITYLRYDDKISSNDAKLSQAVLLSKDIIPEDSQFDKIPNEAIMKYLQTTLQELSKEKKVKPAPFVINNICILGNRLADSQRTSKEEIQKFFNLCILIQEEYKTSRNQTLYSAYSSLMNNDFLKAKFVEIIFDKLKELDLKQQDYEYIERIYIDLIKNHTHNLNKALIENIIEAGVTSNNTKLFNALELIYSNKDISNLIGKSILLSKLNFYYFNKNNYNLKTVFGEVKKEKSFSYENNLILLVESKDLKKLLELDSNRPEVFLYTYSVIYGLLLNSNKRDFSFSEISKLLKVSIS